MGWGSGFGKWGVGGDGVGFVGGGKDIGEDRVNEVMGEI